MAKKDFNFDVEGKVAVITGAAMGIGKSIAELFSKKGAKLVLIDLSDEVVKVAEEMGCFGNTVLPIVADLSKSGDVERAVKTAIEAHGRIDILVNNAGVVFLEPAEDLPLEDWNKTIAVNLTAPFLLSQLVGRRMIKQKSGKIINLSSQAAFIGLDQHIAYCASKSGITGITKVLAIEWAKHNINVNAIAPTVVLTELGKKAWAGKKGENMKKQIPMGRFAYPEEIAATALFLASDASDMITGETIIIDGGYTSQ